MSVPEFPLKPPKLSETLKKVNPMKEVGSVLREGIQSIQGAIDDIDSSIKGIDGGTRTQPKAEEAPASITDEETLRYELDKLLKEARQFEIHLSEGCKIEGKPCDCCVKHAKDIRYFSQETISIASRMGRDPTIFKELADWARKIESISSVEDIESGKYDSQYLDESGTASRFRKELEKMRYEVRPKGFRETCQECGAIEGLKVAMERKRAGGAKG